jgi:hypothetical protein
MTENKFYGFKPYGYYHRDISALVDKCNSEIMSNMEKLGLSVDPRTPCDEGRIEKCNDLYGNFSDMIDLISGAGDADYEVYLKAVVLRGKFIKNLNYLTKNDVEEALEQDEN